MKGIHYCHIVFISLLCIFSANHAIALSISCPPLSEEGVGIYARCSTNICNDFFTVKRVIDGHLCESIIVVEQTSPTEILEINKYYNASYQHQNGVFRFHRKFSTQAMEVEVFDYSDWDAIHQKYLDIVTNQHRGFLFVTYVIPYLIVPALIALFAWIGILSLSSRFSVITVLLPIISTCLILTVYILSNIPWLEKETEVHWDNIKIFVIIGLAILWYKCWRHGKHAKRT